MRKKAKRILSMLIVTAMLLSLGMTAFAAEGTTTYDITISDANAGHTYGAYQLFSGDISGEGEEAIQLLVDIEWGASVTGTNGLSEQILTALKGSTTLGTYFSSCTTADDVAKVLRDEMFTSYGTLMNDFAEVVGTVFVDNSVATYQKTSTYNEEDGTYTFEDVSAGYYLIMDTTNVTGDASTLYILDVAKNITVTPKTGVPTVEKKVMEDSELSELDDLPLDGSNYNDAADWDIGQTQSFTIYAKLPEEMWGYDTYEINFYDTFEDAFTITDASGNALADGTIDVDNYNVYYYSGITRKELASSTFTGTLAQSTGTGVNGTIAFKCSDIKAALAASGVTSGAVTVVIEYYAQLNENAELGLTGNFNEVYLEYSNDPYSDQKGKTEEDKVVVFTFEFEGTKVDADDTTVVLDGAEFILGRSTSGSGDGANVANEWAVLDEKGYFQSWTTDKDVATTLTSGEDGKFIVYGLDSGTYFLTETKAPAGYNKLDSDIKIQVISIYDPEKDSGNYDDIYTQDWVGTDATTVISGYRLTINNETTGIYQYADPVKFTVENESGSKLPETGDTGRAIFYAIGAMGFSAAAIILITRKRMSKYKK